MSRLYKVEKNSIVLVAYDENSLLEREERREDNKQAQIASRNTSSHVIARVRSVTKKDRENYKLSFRFFLDVMSSIVEKGLFS